MAAWACTPATVIRYATPALVNLRGGLAAVNDAREGSYGVRMVTYRIAGVGLRTCLLLTFVITLGDLPIFSYFLGVYLFIYIYIYKTLFHRKHMKKYLHKF